MTGPRLVLVGLPASGKTTVGTAVADALGVGFRDTDHDVEAESGCSISDLFVEHGEPHFRALEQRAIARALDEHDGVLSLGSGAVMDAATRQRLVAYGAAGGTVVWLDVDLRTAADRAGLSTARPLLPINPRATLRAMIEARNPLYAEVATATVPGTGRAPEDVVADVLAALAGELAP